MRAFVRTTLMMLLAMAATATFAHAQTNWTLSWSDEFDGSAIDPAIWNVENSLSDSYGGDAQAWLAANVVVSNGTLSLLSKRESSQGRSYTSGAVTTQNKLTFGGTGQDFRLEVRAKTPRGQGVWPAIWTLEGKMPNPVTGIEVDLMELLGQDPTVVYLNEHVWQDSTDTNKPASCQITGSDFSAGYHVFAIEQSGSNLRWLIDGVQKCASTKVASQPSYLLLNTSIGGGWPGEPTSSTPFPQEFDIDYVRLYTKGTSTGDTTAPSVSVTSPTGGSTVSGTTTLTASASDNVGVTSVWFTVDGTTVGSEDTAAPYNNSWATTGVANGTHQIVAMARDAAGNTASSKAVSVTVNNTTADTTAPTVNVTAPAGGSTVKGTVTLSASASDNVKVASVQFTVDGTNVGSLDTATPYNTSWNSSGASNGSHLIRAIAKDAAGNTTTSTAVTVTVSNTTADTTAPTVSVTAPAGGTTVKGTVTVSASASDNVGVVGVTFTVDGTAVAAEDTAAPFSVNWSSAGVSNGSHALRAVARDAAGNSKTSSAVMVTVNNSTADTTAPTITITSPSSRSTVSGNVSLVAAASDNVGVTSVQFLIDGVVEGTATLSSSSYRLTWSTSSQDNGSHTITAVARDAAGNSRTSSSVMVTVRNTNRRGR